MNAQHPKTLGLFALLLATLAILACGGDEGDPMDQGPLDDDQQPPPLDIQGDPIVAVDANNNMFIFGSENPETIALTLKITGLPFLRNIIGIDFRPSNGNLYGVGNDARVYIIDATGAATAVSSEPFTSEIGILDHFGMGIDPETERIRLFSASRGVNWSINPDDGTAVREGDPHYAAGDPNEGKSLQIAAFDYVPLSARGEFDRGLAAPQPNPITAVAYDAFNGALAGIVDPETGEFISLGPVEGISATMCSAVAFDPSGFLLALVPLVALAGPEAAGAYALVRLSGTGVISNVAGQLGSLTIPTAIQTMGFFKAVAGSSGPVSATRAEAGASAMIGSALTAQAQAGPASWSTWGPAASMSTAMRNGSPSARASGSSISAATPSSSLTGTWSCGT